nr:Chain C, peptide [synthetic construct]6Q0U_D Chain D, peptide [synthetic construct]
YYESGWL